MIKQFAHAEDLHASDSPQIIHILTTPLVALAIYLGFIAMGYFALKILNWKKSQILLAFLFFNLAAGLLLISTVPLVSGIAITVGIFTAFMTFLGGQLK